jgi:hypothetical protein
MVRGGRSEFGSECVHWKQRSQSPLPLFIVVEASLGIGSHFEGQLLFGRIIGNDADHSAGDRLAAPINDAAADLRRARPRCRKAAGQTERGPERHCSQPSGRRQHSLALRGRSSHRAPNWADAIAGTHELAYCRLMKTIGLRPQGSVGNVGVPSSFLGMVRVAFSGVVVVGTRAEFL